MSNVHNSFNSLSKNMSNANNDKIEDFYKNVSQYYNEIGVNMATTLFNWAMGLNTLAIGLTVSVMANYLSSQTLSLRGKFAFLVLIALYLIGILLAYASGFLEKKRFSEKGRLLEGKFDDFISNKITGQEIIDHTYKSQQNLDKVVPGLEYSSVGCAIIGCIASIILLFYI